MHSPIDSLLFFTKFLTGLLLLLNIILILSIRISVNAIKTCEAEAVAMGRDPRKPRMTALTLLAVAVICINGLAVWGNHMLLRSTEDVTRTFSSE